MKIRKGENKQIYPHVNTQLIGKDPNSGKDGKQKEKGTSEDEMVGWHHRFNGDELGQTPEDCAGQEAWFAAVHGVTKSQTRLSN